VVAAVGGTRQRRLTCCTQLWPVASSSKGAPNTPQRQHR
jgi:hypothetical protein